MTREELEKYVPEGFKFHLMILEGKTDVVKSAVFTKELSMNPYKRHSWCTTDDMKGWYINDFWTRDVIDKGDFGR